MIITDKMIKELQRRMDVSYEEAERYLKRAGGNIDLAESYARKKKRTLSNRIVKESEKLLNACFVYHFKVERKNHILMDIPIFTIIILFFVIGSDDFLSLGIVFIIGALITECHMELHHKHSEETYQLYRTVKKTPSEGRKSREQEESYYETEGERVDNPIAKAPPLKRADATSKSEEDLVTVVEEAPHDDIEEEEFYEVTIDK